MDLFVKGFVQNNLVIKKYLYLRLILLGIR